jgi:hypothetical protein
MAERDASDPGHDASVDDPGAALEDGTVGVEPDGSQSLDAAALEDGDVPDADATADPGADGAADASDPCPTDPFCTLSMRFACTDASLEGSLCAMGCRDATCNSSCEEASELIDQGKADDHAGNVNWQSFRVAQTGVLTALELRPNVYSATGDPSMITLSIYAGEGVAGTPIAQAQYTLPSVSLSPWHTFSFATPVPLQASAAYTFEILGAKSVYYAKSDVYGDGRSKFASYDVTFRLHAAACF